MKEIVLDTETTGISVKEGHRIVEIGCIELDNLIPTKKKFHYYLNPEKKFSQIVDEFLIFIDGKRLIIHNAEFDLSHLNNELKISGKKSIKNNIVDTLVLARDKFPGAPSNLDALCKRYRIDNSRRTKHSALIDCDLLAKVYINLIDQKEPTLDFSNQEKITDQESHKEIIYFKKVIAPSKEELESHSHYLKSQIKKNFFN